MVWQGSAGDRRPYADRAELSVALQHERDARAYIIASSVETRAVLDHDILSRATLVLRTKRKGEN